MYLVIEKSKGVYASFETATHFKQAEAYRQHLRRLPPAVLDDNCDLEELGDHFYIAVPVTSAARRSKKVNTTKPKPRRKKSA